MKALIIANEVAKQASKKGKSKKSATAPDDEQFESLAKEAKEAGEMPTSKPKQFKK